MNTIDKVDRYIDKVDRYIEGGLKTLSSGQQQQAWRRGCAQQNHRSRSDAAWSEGTAVFENWKPLMELAVCVGQEKTEAKSQKGS